MTKLSITSQQNLKRGLIVFALMLVFTSFAFLSRQGVASNIALTPGHAEEVLSENDRIEVFEKVWKAVSERYYDPAFNGVDWNAVHERYHPLVVGLKNDEEFYTLLNRMLAELHDAHTLFRTPRQIEARKKQQIVSAGVSIREVEGTPVIYTVDADSDAAHAGVKPGMVVQTIDGQPFAERFAQARREVNESSSERLTQQRIYSRLLSGALTASVKLGLTRADGTTFDVTLPRRIVSSAPPLISQLLPSGYAYIKFNAFRSQYVKEFKEALTKFKNAPALIIDLRSNGGGDVENMLPIANYFFGSRVLFARAATRSGKPLSAFGGLVSVPTEAYVGGAGKQIYGNPVVILINERTASAAESFTMGMKENNRATVIGSQSCGCVNIVNDFNTIKVKGGGELEISEMGYLSPKGHKLEGIGITPDRVVALTLSDLRARRDAGIEEAENFLKNTIKK